VTAATYSAYAGSKAPVEHFSKAFAKAIGPVMRFLAAPKTRWVTAQTVYVNGGLISPIN